MKLIVHFLLLVLTFFLTSCASQKDVDINRSFDDALISHGVEQTVQVQSKVTAIADIMVYECEDNTEACGVAKAMSKMLGAQYIAQVTPQEFIQQRPDTSLRVQNTLAGFGGQLITGGVTLGTVKFFTDQAPATTFKNRGDVINSGNTTEARTTTWGDENEGLAASTEKDKDESIEETVTTENNTSGGYGGGY